MSISVIGTDASARRWCDGSVLTGTATGNATHLSKKERGRFSGFYANGRIVWNTGWRWTRWSDIDRRCTGDHAPLQSSGFLASIEETEGNVNGGSLGTHASIVQSDSFDPNCLTGSRRRLTAISPTSKRMGALPTASTSQAEGTSTGGSTGISTPNLRLGPSQAPLPKPTPHRILAPVPTVAPPLRVNSGIGEPPGSAPSPPSSSASITVPSAATVSSSSIFWRCPSGRGTHEGILWEDGCVWARAAELVGRGLKAVTSIALRAT